ncbi:MAG TPA: diacylglycerol kinase family protein [Chitinophagaceae bacterium]|nr:diacylglycerol kinase family protein [Chitinophagaceae bacterium]
MKNKKSFSIHARGRSFKYAFEGIKVFFRSEHNAWLHLLGTITVIILAVVVHVSRIEIIALTFAIGFVWTAELFNTAIEKIMDFVSMEQDPKIRFIKDLSAAAVLVAAVVAVITGCIIFIPKL